MQGRTDREVRKPHARSEIHEPNRESRCAMWIQLRNFAMENQSLSMERVTVAPSSRKGRRNYTGERLLQTILNRVEKFKSFLYRGAGLENQGNDLTLSSDRTS